MKKTLLSLFALATIAVNAQTVSEGYYLNNDWTVNQGLPAAGDGRWGAAYGDNFYINAKGSGLYSFAAADGAKVAVDGVISTSTGFNFDGAGNAMLSNGFPNVQTIKDFTLWNATTGETSSLVIPDQIFTTLGYTAARMDFMGRGAGNIFSEEGGAFFLASSTAGKILKVYIKNGALDTEKTKVITGPTTGDNGTIVIPLTNDPNSDDVLYRFRTNRNFYYNNGTEWVAQEKVGSVSQSSGGDIVTLNGVLYTIEPAGTNYYDGWQIVNRETNTVVATVAESTGTAYKNTTGYNTILSVVKNSETKATIYHSHFGLYVKKYTFAVPGDVLTAIEEVEVDANAPVEYYNLQGVKVENPENGIFIKKQGTKATKVVL